MGSDRVGGEVHLKAFVGDLALVDHAAGVVDQNVQLLVFGGELVGKLTVKKESQIFDDVKEQQFSFAEKRNLSY